LGETAESEDLSWNSKNPLNVGALPNRNQLLSLQSTQDMQKRIAALEQQRGVGNDIGIKDIWTFCGRSTTTCRRT
jgi:hypothetical protein